MRLSTGFICCLMVLTNTFGQSRKYVNEFLEIGVGARAIGMSKSVTASVDDVTAGFWNPAGLLKITDDRQIALMHNEHFAGIAKNDYGAIAIPLKQNKGVMALSMVRLGVDNIPNTLLLRGADGAQRPNFDNISAFSVADYAFMFSYAKNISWAALKERENPWKDIHFGMTTKIIHRRAGAFARAWGIGLDVGIQWKKGNWDFGVVGQDITSSFNAWKFDFTDEEERIFAITGNVVPERTLEVGLPRVNAGIGYNLQLGKQLNLLSEANFSFTTDGQRNTLITLKPLSIDPRMGLELDYKKLLFLRGGIGNIQRVLSENLVITQDDAGKDVLVLENSNVLRYQPNLGVGMRLKNLVIDYAFANPGQQAGAFYSHIVSIKLKLTQRPQAN